MARLEKKETAKSARTKKDAKGKPTPRSSRKPKVAARANAATPRARRKPTRLARIPRTKGPVDFAALRERIVREIPAPYCELDFQSPWQLLVATILAAQSTDKMINKITPALFAAYPTPAALGAAAQEDVERLVKSSGFFRNKAKSIRAASARIAEVFGGEVPRAMDDMLTLAGVARKTANVVLGTAYGVAQGMAIDTHATRVSRKLGLTKHSDPVKIENDLVKRFPESEWTDMGHRLVLHGRYVCDAKKPACSSCALNEICPSREALPTGTWEERAERARARIDSRGALPLVRPTPPTAEAEEQRDASERARRDRALGFRVSNAASDAATAPRSAER